MTRQRIANRRKAAAVQEAAEGPGHPAPEQPQAKPGVCKLCRRRRPLDEKSGACLKCWASVYLVSR